MAVDWQVADQISVYWEIRCTLIVVTSACPVRLHGLSCLWSKSMSYRPFIWYGRIRQRRWADCGDFGPHPGRNSSRACQMISANGRSDAIAWAWAIFMCRCEMIILTCIPESNGVFEYVMDVAYMCASLFTSHGKICCTLFRIHCHTSFLLNAKA